MRRMQAEEQPRTAPLASQCPHLHLWPVPSCHAKYGRIHIQSDQTVREFCVTAAHHDCILFQQTLRLGAAR
jgi:muconolactone delta-isomerase